eukprot:430796-Amphidinium_carterae.2
MGQGSSGSLLHYDASSERSNLRGRLEAPEGISDLGKMYTALTLCTCHSLSPFSDAVLEGGQRKDCVATRKIATYEEDTALTKSPMNVVPYNLNPMSYSASEGL